MTNTLSTTTTTTTTTRWGRVGAGTSVYEGIARGSVPGVARHEVGGICIQTGQRSMDMAEGNWEVDGAGRHWQDEVLAMYQSTTHIYLSVSSE
jgi:hypothetical protein